MAALPQQLRLVFIREEMLIQKEVNHDDFCDDRAANVPSLQCAAYIWNSIHLSRTHFLSLYIILAFDHNNWIDNQTWNFDKRQMISLCLQPVAVCFTVLLSLYLVYVDGVCSTREKSLFDFVTCFVVLF